MYIPGGVRECCLQHGLDFYDVRPPKMMMKPLPTSVNLSNSLQGLASKMDYRITTTVTLAPLRTLSIPMHSVSSAEVAELTKIVENAHRFLQIAFAEELYLYCQSNNIRFQELVKSINTKWNVEILEPRDGIGGHCLPKDTKMFVNSSSIIKSKILQAAMEIDKGYREYIQSREKQVSSLFLK